MKTKTQLKHWTPSRTARKGRQAKAKRTNDWMPILRNAMSWRSQYGWDYYL